MFEVVPPINFTNYFAFQSSSNFTKDYLLSIFFFKGEQNFNEIFKSVIGPLAYFMMILGVALPFPYAIFSPGVWKLSHRKKLKESSHWIFFFSDLGSLESKNDRIKPREIYTGN